MKIKIFLLTCLFAFGALTKVVAQDKIAYANIQLILAYMNETKTMQSSLRTYSDKLAQQLKPKQDYLQQKRAEVEEWYAKNQDATEEQIRPKAEELQKLQEELQKAGMAAEERLAKRQSELMLPITEKLEAAVKTVANANGFDIVLNTTDGSGVSIVLYGPEDRDLTEKIMKQLGISIPSAGN